MTIAPHVELAGSIAKHGPPLRSDAAGHRGTGILADSMVVAPGAKSTTTKPASSAQWTAILSTVGLDRAETALRRVEKDQTKPPHPEESVLPSAAETEAPTVSVVRQAEAQPIPHFNSSSAGQPVSGRCNPSSLSMRGADKTRSNPSLKHEKSRKQDVSTTGPTSVQQSIAWMPQAPQLAAHAVNVAAVTEKPRASEDFPATPSPSPHGSAQVLSTSWETGALQERHGRFLEGNPATGSVSGIEPQPLSGASSSKTGQSISATQKVALPSSLDEISAGHSLRLESSQASPDELPMVHVPANQQVKDLHGDAISGYGIGINQAFQGDAIARGAAQPGRFDVANSKNAKASGSSHQDAHSPLPIHSPRAAIQAPLHNTGELTHIAVLTSTVPSGTLIDPRQIAEGGAFKGMPGEGQSQETFAAMDSAEGQAGPTWIHASANKAEAGFHDAALGWVSVRAEMSATGIHAALVGGTAEAAQSLNGHLAGLSNFLHERQTPVQVLHVTQEGSGWAQGDSSSMQQGADRQGSEHNDSLERGGLSTAASIIGTASKARNVEAPVGGGRNGEINISHVGGRYVSVIA